MKMLDESRVRLYVVLKGLPTGIYVGPCVAKILDDKLDEYSQ